MIVLCLFSRRIPLGDRRADPRSFEPRRFGRRDRGARVPDGKTESHRKWRRNGLKRLNPRLEMVWARKPRTHKIWYTGAMTATAEEPQERQSYEVAEKGAQGFEMVTCRTEIGALRPWRPPGAKKGPRTQSGTVVDAVADRVGSAWFTLEERGALRQPRSASAATGSLTPSPAPSSSAPSTPAFCGFPARSRARPGRKTFAGRSLRASSSGR